MSSTVSIFMTLNIACPFTATTTMTMTMTTAIAWLFLFMELASWILFSKSLRVGFWSSDPSPVA